MHILLLFTVQRLHLRCRVFACTLPGFGPSEKSPQVYTTAFWKAYVRDFVVNVVRQPAFIAGNSIGGVIPANACADHPHLFKGIVLINTAGSSATDFDPNAPPVEAKPRGKTFVNATSWLTFRYLQRGIANQLRKVYPVRPENADKFLNDEIYRASCDPCALQVRPQGQLLLHAWCVSSVDMQLLKCCSSVLFGAWRGCSTKVCNVLYLAHVLRSCKMHDYQMTMPSAFIPTSVLPTLLSVQVLRSGFYLAPQRPLPYLLNQLYQGPVLILQGVLDPLNSARDRADTLEAAIPNATKVCIEAGHCPHDEVPELVNDAIAEFVENVVGGRHGRKAAKPQPDAELQLEGVAV